MFNFALFQIEGFCIMLLWAVLNFWWLFSTKPFCKEFFYYKDWIFVTGCICFAVGYVQNLEFALFFVAVAMVAAFANVYYYKKSDV